MRTGIATLSVRGRLLDKLPAIAAAGFDGIEVFDNDLVACPAPPREVAARCTASQAWPTRFTWRPQASAS